MPAALSRLWRPVVLALSMALPFILPGAPEGTLPADHIGTAALLPPVLAIAAALLWRRTILALFLGIWLGATLLSAASGAFLTAPLLGLDFFARDLLWTRALHDEFKVQIIGFVFAISAAIGVMTRSGGIRGMVDVLVRWAKTSRSCQAVTASLGLAIFFDDYSNTIVVGSTMRPLTDRMRISREKLAYLVDSTAAPVAGLAMLSTWVAYLVSTYAPSLPQIGIPEERGFAMFIEAIPYRFYCIFTLIFIAWNVITGRDYGPMRLAQQRAHDTGNVIAPGATPMVSKSLTMLEPKDGQPCRWVNGLAPILSLIGVTLWQIVSTGDEEGRGLLAALGDLGYLRHTVLGSADSTWAILMGSVSAFVLALLLALSQRILSLAEALSAALSGMKSLMIANAILFCAWCIGYVCEDLGTAAYLQQTIGRALSPELLPAVFFITAAFVAFATGSSWSTMAILLPNIVVLAWGLGAQTEVGQMAILLMTIGAVLEGSIFGDHCSPLSDTTILSSVASASDHVDHVRTQMPYALTTMAIAMACGYLPVSFLGWSPGLCLVLGAATCLGALLVFGRTVSPPPDGAGE